MRRERQSSKTRGSAGRGVVATAVGDPVEVEQAGDVGQIGVVADEKQDAVGGLAKGSRNALAKDGLLQRGANAAEEMGGLRFWRWPACAR